jgi:hypothetical protein
MEEQKSALTFISFEVFNLNFEATRAIRLDLVPEGGHKLSEEQYISIGRHKNDRERISIFYETHLMVDGYFKLVIAANAEMRLSPDLSAEFANSLLKTNAVAIGYPYLRAVIATITSNLGGTCETINLGIRRINESDIEIIEIDDDIQNDNVVHNS